MSSLTPARAVALGGLTIAILDGLDAVIFFGLRGVRPGRLFQGIASGLLGPSAFQGGAVTVLLGLALHLFIATSIAWVACLVAGRFPVVLRRPFLAGPLYGIGVWLVMNFVVIPLSALPPRVWHLPVVLNGLAIHMTGVGIPAVLFARAAVAASAPRPAPSA